VCAARTQDLPHFTSTEPLEKCVWALAEDGKIPDVSIHLFSEQLFQFVCICADRQAVRGCRTA